MFSESDADFFSNESLPKKTKYFFPILRPILGAYFDPLFSEKYIKWPVAKKTSSWIVVKKLFFCSLNSILKDIKVPGGLYSLNGRKKMLKAEIWGFFDYFGLFRVLVSPGVPAWTWI